MHLCVHIYLPSHTTTGLPARVCPGSPRCLFTGTPVRCPLENENFACEWGSRGRTRAVLNLHLCVRRSGVLGVEMKTLPGNDRRDLLVFEYNVHVLLMHTYQKNPPACSVSSLIETKRVKSRFPIQQSSTRTKGMADERSASACEREGERRSRDEGRFPIQQSTRQGHGRRAQRIRVRARGGEEVTWS